MLKKFVFSLMAVCLLVGCGGNPTEYNSSNYSGKPAPSAEYSFMVMADTEEISEAAFCGSMTSMNAVASAHALNPDFLLVAGDLVESGAEQYGYLNWQMCIGNLFGVPVFPIGGETDFADGFGAANFAMYQGQQLNNINSAYYGSNYWTDFTLDIPSAAEIAADMPTVPSGTNYGTHFAFKYKNSAFLMFEIGGPSEINTPIAWVQRKLQQYQADPDVDFIFVVTYAPMMSVYTDDAALQPARLPYYQDLVNANVLAVFSGHDHIFSRYYAPYDGSPGRTARDRVSYGEAMTLANVGPTSFPPPAGLPPEFTGQLSWNNHQGSFLGYNVLMVEVTSPGEMVISAYNTGVYPPVKVNELKIKDLP